VDRGRDGGGGRGAPLDLLDLERGVFEPLAQGNVFPAVLEDPEGPYRRARGVTEQRGREPHGDELAVPRA